MRACRTSTGCNPELNAVVWRNDEEARAAAAAADRRLATGEEAPFLGVPMPIKDLTPVAGWPVTYGSRGAPEGLSEESELVVDALAQSRLRVVRPHQHAGVRRDHRGREQPLRRQSQPVGHEPLARRLQRRRRRRGRRGHVPDRPRQRRRRLDPHPRLLLRPGRLQAEPRSRAAAGPELARRGRRGRRLAHRRRLRRRARCDRRPRPARLVQRARRPSAPFAEETACRRRAACASG